MSNVGVEIMKIIFTSLLFKVFRNYFIVISKIMLKHLFLSMLTQAYLFNLDYEHASILNLKLSKFLNPYDILLSVFIFVLSPSVIPLV